MVKTQIMGDNELMAHKIVTEKQKIEEEKKEQQNSMMGIIVFMIIALSIFAAIMPAWDSDGSFDYNKVQIQWAFFGIVVAFMIFFIFSRGIVMQRRELQHTTSDKKAYRDCPYCGRAITFEVNVCPYCERTIR